MEKLILPSCDPVCSRLLQQICVNNFTTAEVSIDKTPLPFELPRNYALRMAREKVRSTKGNFVLGASSVVSVGRRILPTAQDRQTVKYCLTLLSGRRHTVYGGLYLRAQNLTHSAVIKTVVKFKVLSQKNIDSYMETSDWAGTVGGYTIEGVAGRYVSFISGSYSNVVGLDTYTVGKWLEAYGY